MKKNKKTSIYNSKKNNPSNKIDQKILFNIITAISSIIAIVISIFTLCEMIKDRTAAYKPSVLINPTQYSFSWDSNGNLDWLTSSTPTKYTENELKTTESNKVTGELTIPINILNDNMEQFSAVNVGVGSAKQITFKWHDSNIVNLNNYLIQCDQTKNDFMKINKSVVFDYEGKIIGMGLPSETSLMYMLPEATETYKIPLPTAYYIMIQEIIKSGGNNNIPYLLLSVDYLDIQGNEYSDTFVIKVQMQIYSEGMDNSGNATFQLIPLFQK